MWTLPRIATLIQEKFAVRLAISSVWGLLGRMAGVCSGRRPARQRDERPSAPEEQEVAGIKKNRSATAANHRLHRRVGPVERPCRARTWAPEGNSRSAIQLQLETTFRDCRRQLLAVLFPIVSRFDQGPQIVEFLKALLATIGRKSADHLGSIAGPPFHPRARVC